MRVNLALIALISSCCCGLADLVVDEQVSTPPPTNQTEDANASPPLAANESIGSAQHVVNNQTNGTHQSIPSSPQQRRLSAAPHHTNPSITAFISAMPPAIPALPEPRALSRHSFMSEQNDLVARESCKSWPASCEDEGWSAIFAQLLKPPLLPLCGMLILAMFQFFAKTKHHIGDGKDFFGVPNLIYVAIAALFAFDPTKGGVNLYHHASGVKANPDSEQLWNIKTTGPVLEQVLGHNRSALYQNLGAMMGVITLFVMSAVQLGLVQDSINPAP